MAPSNKPFDCSQDVERAAIDLVNKCRYHVGSEQTVTQKHRHEGGHNVNFQLGGSSM